MIDADTTIDGKINGKDVTIAGKFKGEVHLTGALVLTSSASVDATVQASLLSRRISHSRHSTPQIRPISQVIRMRSNRLSGVPVR